MKTTFTKTLLLTFLIINALSSCRKEEIESIQAPADEVLIADSSIASLIQKTSSNDGSNDNIIDKSNCFNIKFPINVTVNGNDITVNSEDDYKIIEFIFDDSDDDIDSLIISFPVTITLEDFTEITINSLTELNSYSTNCNGENEPDDDIECLDFKYPISASVFNKDNEIIKAVTISSDNEFYGFIKNLSGSNNFVTINFPIDVTLADGSQILINNLKELESIINVHKNDCDEDDDYDYNDDDCNECDEEQLALLLTSCSDWSIDKLERYYRNYDYYYDGYIFNFFTDGTVSAYYDNTTDYGTWTTSGTGKNLVVNINIPNLPYCNNNWVLNEISQYTTSRVDLRVGDSDRMRYKNSCN